MDCFTHKAGLNNSLSVYIVFKHVVQIKLIFFLSQTLYWASVEESLPKWEQFLLGRAEAPVGFKKLKTTKQNLSYSEEDSQN